MIALEINATVTPEGQVTLWLPPTIPPGEHRVVLVIDAEVTHAQGHRSLESPLPGYEPWSKNVSLQREEVDENKEARLREFGHLRSRLQSTHPGEPNPRGNSRLQQIWHR